MRILQKAKCLQLVTCIWPKANRNQKTAINQHPTSFYVVVALAFVLFTGCYTLIDPKLPQLENIPVANAFLQHGYPVQIMLTHSAKPDTAAINAINNAQVRLFVDGIFTEELNYLGDAIYEGTTIVEAGKKYSCKIALPNADTLFCEDMVPLPEEILGIEHINIAGKDKEGYTYPALKLTFSNRVNMLSYYEIIIRAYTPVDDRYFEFFKIAKIMDISDPVLLNEGLPIVLFSNETISDSVYTMHINYFTNMIENIDDNRRTLFWPLIIELRTVSYNYYKYQKQLYLYKKGIESNGVLESMTSAPIFSNVENGSGIFAGYSSMFSDTLFPAYER